MEKPKKQMHTRNIKFMLQGELTDTKLHEDTLQITASIGFNLCGRSIMTWNKCVNY